MLRIATAFSARLLFTIPVSWLAYQAVNATWQCFGLKLKAGPCISHVVTTTALRTMIPTLQDSERPLVEVYLPILLIGMVAAALWIVVPQMCGVGRAKR
jgi:hypothetical protein